MGRRRFRWVEGDIVMAMACDIHPGQLANIIPWAGDAEFRAAWLNTKPENKKRLARYILRKIGTGVNP